MSFFTDMHGTSRICSQQETTVLLELAHRVGKQAGCAPPLPTKQLHPAPSQGPFSSLSSSSSEKNAGDSHSPHIHPPNHFKLNFPRSWITLVNASQYWNTLNFKSFQVRVPKDRHCSSSVQKKKCLWVGILFTRCIVLFGFLKAMSRSDSLGAKWKEKVLNNTKSFFWQLPKSILLNPLESEGHGRKWLLSKV